MRNLLSTLILTVSLLGGAAVLAQNNIPGGLKGGLPAPNAAYIDADRIFSFNGGSAIIRKGTSSALIDSAGKFVQPYNAYDFNIFIPNANGYSVYYNKIYPYNNTNHQWGGYMNARGTIIFKTSVSSGLTDLTGGKRVIRNTPPNSRGTLYIYYTADGKKYQSSAYMETVSDNISVVSPRSGANDGYAYVKLDGAIIAKGFSEAYPFSEGLACVGKPDQFGQIKYGFINTEGKLVVPYTFSVKPKDFSGGFARVEPKDKTQFEYAFIDRSGNIVYKQTQADIAANGSFDHFTNFGLAFSGKAVLDNQFRIVKLPEFFAAFGLPADCWLLKPETYTEGETNPKLVYGNNKWRNPYTKMPVVGFIDLGTKKVVAPVFDLTQLEFPGIWFDPVSHLALAMVCTGRNNNNVPIYREGYINEAGEFVLIKGAKSTW